ncbi:hypothetical protein HMPREF0620_0971 [Parascardovia denticolens DSM 10105 = JCM 12538]|uniref:Uncharacterized protein n=1 Tax=Parascardovia denticolens DSM 10105 = JCM 12538 TaxID=864564 RepID=E6JZ76_PARDN|nr:hypothetical protein HMPREF0620_0971 [Parascardovia denticolens DSM 10105 = JCM 12538]BAR05191.1 hypothetical protein PSDT_0672 [Parascardovia denticolens DSM 10105 = JCM 12538]
MSNLYQILLQVRLRPTRDSVKYIPSNPIASPPSSPDFRPNPRKRPIRFPG